MITDIATIGVGVDSTGVERGKTALDSFAASGARAERSTESLAGSTAILGRVYRDLAAVIATLGVKNLVTESASLSQRYQELGIVLGVVSKNAGLVRDRKSTRLNSSH